MRQSPQINQHYNDKGKHSVPMFWKPSGSKNNFEAFGFCGSCCTKSLLALQFYLCLWGHFQVSTHSTYTCTVSQGDSHLDQNLRPAAVENLYWGSRAPKGGFITHKQLRSM